MSTKTGKFTAYGAHRAGIWALRYRNQDTRTGVKFSRDDTGWLLSGGIRGRAIGIGWIYRKTGGISFTEGILPAIVLAIGLVAYFWLQVPR
ncbi:hypothetical protein [Rhodococcoides fascians]|uniref:hypothetical protein n=1 Tax=Rhodococcoides fascians TaxID=1828 RepID=UPI00050CC99F|nr:hypothetical protein [Rhodococcus fascians]